MVNRQRIRKSEPAVTEQLAVELRQLVRELAGSLGQVFTAYRQGRIGSGTSDITLNLFARWCAESGTAPLSRMVYEIDFRRRTNAASARELSRLFVDRGFPAPAAAEVADSVAAELMHAKLTKAQIELLCWPLYEQAIQKLCTQTAHVLVARMLFYRIGEDGAGLPVRISGAALVSAMATGVSSITLQFPAISLFERLRSEQECFLPVLY